MPKTKKIAPTTNAETLRWEISPYDFVDAFVGEEKIVGIPLDSFYTSVEEASATIESLKFGCVYDGLDVKDTFSKLVAVVKAHFNLGTVMYMHMFEKFA